jgi:hypothetical protein
VFAKSDKFTFLFKEIYCGVITRTITKRSVFFLPEDEVSRFLRNVDPYLPNYKASNPRRPQSSEAFLYRLGRTEVAPSDITVSPV